MSAPTVRGKMIAPRLDPELREQVEQYAREQRRSLASAARRLIELGLRAEREGGTNG